MNLRNINTLDDLWCYTRTLHKQLFPDSKLAPIMSGGKNVKPKYMFIFINPTYKNISSDPSWEGKRRPWTGTKYIWKIFHNAGHFDANLLAEIASRKTWDIEFSDKVYIYIEEKGFYFTNIVKWTGENGDLPDTKKIKSFLPILLKEIELVDPTYIITFGLIPFTALVKEQIKLKDYYDSSVASNKLKTYSLNINNKEYKVIPCYFPVGRGNPTKATKILRMLS